MYPLKLNVILLGKDITNNEDKITNSPLIRTFHNLKK